MSLWCSHREDPSYSFYTQTYRDPCHSGLAQRLDIYIFLTSAVRAMRWKRNLSSMSTNDGWMLGPTRSVTFSETPVVDLAEASNTTLSIVMVLCSFLTACIGR